MTPIYSNFVCLTDALSFGYDSKPPEMTLFLSLITAKNVATRLKAYVYDTLSPVKVGLQNFDK